MVFSLAEYMGRSNRLVAYEGHADLEATSDGARIFPEFRIGGDADACHRHSGGYRTELSGPFVVDQKGPYLLGRHSISARTSSMTSRTRAIPSNCSCDVRLFVSEYGLT